jgi:hypothetical protein
MGGFGSGPRRRRRAVWDCPAVDARDLRRFGVLPPTGGDGVLAWATDLGRALGSVRYRVEPTDGGWVLRLAYRLPSGRAVRVGVPLDPAPYPLGGQRWWLRCPGCGRRARAVYLDGGAFACRVCHALSYPRRERWY